MGRSYSSAQQIKYFDPKMATNDDLKTKLEAIEKLLTESKDNKKKKTEVTKWSNVVKIVGVGGMSLLWFMVQYYLLIRYKDSYKAEITTQVETKAQLAELAQRPRLARLVPNH